MKPEDQKACVKLTPQQLLDAYMSGRENRPPGMEHDALHICGIVCVQAAVLAAQNYHRDAQPAVACSFPERDVTKPAEEQGLFRKFDVRRVDGSDAPGGKHHGCEYFVLDLNHDTHAPAALRAYAQACNKTHPQLSAELLGRFGPQPAVAVNEQDKQDAERYRWLFGARTEDECKHWNVGNLPLKPQDRVIGQVATVFMPKVAVDAEIDAAIAAELRKGGL